MRFRFIILKIDVYHVVEQVHFFKNPDTVEARSTDNRLRPRYYGQFCLSRQKAHTFLLKITRFYGHPLIRKTDTFPCPE